MPAPTFSSFLTEAKSAKNVLFIGYVTDGDDAKERKLISSRCNATFVEWDALSVDMGVVKADGRPVSGWDAVFVGPVHGNDRMATCLRDLLSGKRALFYGGSQSTNNKLLQTVRMRAGGISQVDTLVADPGGVTAAEVVKRIGLPVVAKISNGAKGRGVSKCDTEAELSVLLKKREAADEGPMIFQAFVPNDGDYRVFFVGTRLVYVVKRTRQGEDFRNNVSLGGKMEAADIPKAARDLAARANKAMAFDVSDITGVDLIQNSKTKEWFVMEINSSPNFLKGSVVVDAIIDNLC